jgi:RNA polymerase sigma-70 factor (ECF subfamily)
VPLPLTAPVAAPPDDHLVPRLRAGEEAAIAEAYHRFAAGLLTLAFRLTGRADDAEDVVQELFIGLPEALSTYEERGQLVPWLRRIVVRRALMRLRSRRARSEVAIEQAEHQPTFPAFRSASSADAADSLAAALDRLPEEQRAVLVLKVIEGYSHQEIAELLGIRRNASEVRLHRALVRLRALLEER